MKVFFNSRPKPRLNHRVIIILWIALFLGMAMYLYNALQLRSDSSFFLPEKSTEINIIMQHELKHGAAGKMILIAIQGKEGAVSSQQLADINKQLAKKLMRNSHFAVVQNGQTVNSKLIIEPYYSYRYLLYSQTDKPYSELFSTQGLTESFLQLLQRLQLMISPVEQRLFSEDPQMIWIALLKQWQAQQLQKHHGVWFDQYGKKTLLFVKTHAPGYELQQQKKNIEFINKSIDSSIRSQFNKTEAVIDSSLINTVLSGAPVFALASKNAISQQVKSISVFASFTLMAFLYWFFRSIKIILLIALPLGLAILTGMTIVMLSDGFIHGITIAFGITIIGIAVDYPVHLYSHALLINRPGKDKSLNFLPLLSIVHTIWPMIRLGLMTTLIGFSAIILSDFSGLRQLGLFAISGLFAAAMTTRFLLPVIPLSITRQHAYGKFLNFVNFPIPASIRPLSVVLPILALFYISFQQTILWQKDLSALSPIPQWQKQQDFELRQAMGLPELRYALILQNQLVEELLQQSEQLQPQLDELKEQGIISGYDMAARYLPSRKYQKQQQNKLPQATQLLQRLEQILDKSALDVTAFMPFINAVKKNQQRQALSVDMLLNKTSQNNESNLITDKIKTLLYKQESSTIWTAIIPLQGVRSEQIKQHFFKQDNENSSMQPGEQHIKLLDLKAQSEAMLLGYRNDALVWFFSGTLLILAVLFFSSKKFTSKKLPSLIPLALPFTGAVILTIASLLLMGYSLSIFHLVTLLLVVGLGIDYSIFTFFSNKSTEEMEQAYEIAQVSVTICMISTVIMFSALGFSELPVLKAIGLTASMGAVYAFLLTRLSYKG